MKIKRLAAILSASVLLLSSCSENKNKQIDYPDGDMSWNTQNIMETEKGFYLNNFGMGVYFSSLFLRYYDKNSGSTIMLCNRPECPHDGRETCIATYKDLFCGPTVMYNNEIYFIAQEFADENINVSLYKAAVDGSALDHIKTLYTTKRTSTEEVAGIQSYLMDIHRNTLVIHRGYAYIQIDLNYDYSYSGFLGGGFYKVNLKNGEFKEIISYNDFWGSKMDYYYACGDYIFYKYDRKIYRLNIYDDTTEEILSDKSKKYDIIGCDKDTLYVNDSTDEVSSQKNFNIIEFDAKNMQSKCEYTIPSGEPVAYDGKLITLSDVWNNEGHREIYVYEKGEKVASCLEPEDKEEFFSGVSICSGKLYIESGVDYATLWSCSFEELLSGNVQWKKEYDEKDAFEKWYEYLFDVDITIE